MNSRERFFETLHYGKPDRVPYFEEGIRAEVIAVWKEQGLTAEATLRELFPTDAREEIKLDVSLRPRFRVWPSAVGDLESLRERLDPSDDSRFPENWDIERLRNREEILMVRVHRGFFLSLGVNTAKRFTEVMYLTLDRPEFVRAYMCLQGQFAAALAERALRQVEVDALVFSEPIGDNHGPLISPQMYEDLVLPSYEPLLDLARRYEVKTLICRTYANMKALIPSLLKWGINVLWACEVEPTVMNYASLRQEFGRDLRLIGGIDTDALRQGKEVIRCAMEQIGPLIAEGGYIPLADGRVRADVPFENYVYYRQLLAEITRRG